MSNNEFNIIDKFLYKFIICIVVLLVVVLLDKVKIVKIENLQNKLDEHFNVLSVFKLVNGEDSFLIPIDITEEVSATTKQVYSKSLVITNGRRVILNDYQGVENYKDGVVVKIEKNTDKTFKLIVKGLDNLEYVYDNLESVNVSIYKLVTSGEVIASPSKTEKDNYFDFYIYDQGQVVNLLP